MTNLTSSLLTTTNTNTNTNTTTTSTTKNTTTNNTTPSTTKVQFHDPPTTIAHSPPPHYHPHHHHHHHHHHPSTKPFKSTVPVMPYLLTFQKHGIRFYSSSSNASGNSQLNQSRSRDRALRTRSRTPPEGRCGNGGGGGRTPSPRRLGGLVCPKSNRPSATATVGTGTAPSKPRNPRRTPTPTRTSSSSRPPTVPIGPKLLTTAKYGTRCYSSLQHPEHIPITTTPNQKLSDLKYAKRQSEVRLRSAVSKHRVPPVIRDRKPFVSPPLRVREEHSLVRKEEDGGVFQALPLPNRTYRPVSVDPVNKRGVTVVKPFKLGKPLTMKKMSMTKKRSGSVDIYIYNPVVPTPETNTKCPHTLEREMHTVGTQTDPMDRPDTARTEWSTDISGEDHESGLDGSAEGRVDVSSQTPVERACVALEKELPEVIVRVALSREGVEEEEEPVVSSDRDHGDETGIRETEVLKQEQVQQQQEEEEELQQEPEQQIKQHVEELQQEPEQEQQLDQQQEERYQQLDQQQEEQQQHLDQQQEEEEEELEQQNLQEQGQQLKHQQEIPQQDEQIQQHQEETQPEQEKQIKQQQEIPQQQQQQEEETQQEQEQQRKQPLVIPQQNQQINQEQQESQHEQEQPSPPQEAVDESIQPTPNTTNDHLPPIDPIDDYRQIQAALDIALEDVGETDSVVSSYLPPLVRNEPPPPPPPRTDSGFHTVSTAETTVSSPNNSDPTRIHSVGNRENLRPTNSITLPLHIRQQVYRRGNTLSSDDEMSACSAGRFREGWGSIGPGTEGEGEGRSVCSGVAGSGGYRMGQRVRFGNEYDKQPQGEDKLTINVSVSCDTSPLNSPDSHIEEVTQEAAVSPLISPDPQRNLVTQKVNAKAKPTGGLFRHGWLRLKEFDLSLGGRSHSRPAVPIGKFRFRSKNKKRRHRKSKSAAVSNPVVAAVN